MNDLKKNDFKILEDFNLTPKEIVEYLDKHIIGQKEAKRAIAIALRNRYRKQKIEKKLSEEITPKNIIMIGPTGVGKTEISRRIAQLINAPFIKIEATKFTEVGYVGKDVESIIRDLTHRSVLKEKEKYSKLIEKEVLKKANEECLNLLLPNTEETSDTTDEEDKKNKEERRQKLRSKFALKLEKGDFEETEVKVKPLSSSPSFMPIEIDMNSTDGFDQMRGTFQQMFNQLNIGKESDKKMKIKDVRKMYVSHFRESMVDMDQVIKYAVEKVQLLGIVFLDEIDKVAVSNKNSGEISREGVQRDLLPLVEGTSVNTKYGVVKTDHILFIASGAFHMSKPSDLIPELQGRFPIRVNLSSLDKEQLFEVLQSTENSLIIQYKALLKVEGVNLSFEKKAIEKIAEIASEVNRKTDDIGARRLHTVIEKLLESLLFDAPNTDKKIGIDVEYVEEKLSHIVQDEDLSKYVL